jgi:hypothetical protein
VGSKLSVGGGGQSWNNRGANMSTASYAGCNSKEVNGSVGYRTQLGDGDPVGFCADITDPIPETEFRFAWDKKDGRTLCPGKLSDIG